MVAKELANIILNRMNAVTIMPNPYTSAVKMDIAKSDISDQGLSPISPMPPGLLNRLNETEVASLICVLAVRRR